MTERLRPGACLLVEPRCESEPLKVLPLSTWSQASTLGVADVKLAETSVTGGKTTTAILLAEDFSQRYSSTDKPSLSHFVTNVLGEKKWRPVKRSAGALGRDLMMRLAAST